ncbi:MAG: hypothetical protein JNL21_16695 [Myxococcales bacterium]|nr:hypothetical protein [Myxococcales bacterium]
MHSLLRSWGLPAALLAAVLLHSGTSFACKCGPRSALAEELTNSSTVFLGSVESIRPGRDDGADGPTVTVSMVVSRSFKGNDGARLVVTTPAHASGCGFPFSVNETYLVFASQNEQHELVVSRCSRTAVEDEAAADIRGLEATAPVPKGAKEAAPSASAKAEKEAEPPPGTTEPVRSGCAGCAIGSDRTVSSAVAFGLLCAAAIGRRRKRPGASASAHT